MKVSTKFRGMKKIKINDRRFVLGRWLVEDKADEGLLIFTQMTKIEKEEITQDGKKIVRGRINPKVTILPPELINAKAEIVVTTKQRPENIKELAKQLEKTEKDPKS